MAVAKIKKGDKVKVIAGKFRGLVGSVSKVVIKQRANGSIQKRVAVSGVKKLSKFRKKTVYQGQLYPGQITEVDRLIDSSNVSLIDSKGQTSKVKIEVDSKGNKQRVFKTTNDAVVSVQAESSKKESKNSDKKKVKSTKSK